MGLFGKSRSEKKADWLAEQLRPYDARIQIAEERKAEVEVKYRGKSLDDLNWQERAELQNARNAAEAARSNKLGFIERNR